MPDTPEKPMSVEAMTELIKTVYNLGYAAGYGDGQDVKQDEPKTLRVVYKPCGHPCYSPDCMSTILNVPVHSCPNSTCTCPSDGDTEG